jgi:hypothetical protein
MPLPFFEQDISNKFMEGYQWARFQLNYIYIVKTSRAKGKFPELRTSKKEFSNDCSARSGAAIHYGACYRCHYH